MKYLPIVVLILAIVFFASISNAQGHNEEWVFVTISNGLEHGTDTMGYAVGATNCIDASFGESELPPAPPSGIFDMRFVESECYPTIQGLSLDLHGVNDSTDVYAPFYMSIQKDTTLPILMTFSHGWSSLFYSLEIYDGPSGGVNTLDVIMSPDPERDTLTLAYSATSHEVTTIHDVTMPVLLAPLPGVGVPIKNGSLVPKHFQLSQNYPNPFNPSTTIAFAIEKSATTTVEVFNVLGQRVATLVSAQLGPGYYTARWNGTSDGGATVSSGVYFVHMRASATNGSVAFDQVKKLVFMK
jgi:hypothetical protein